MWIAIIVIGSLIALFLILVSLPLDAVVRLEVEDRLEFRAGFRWCFGLVHKDFERKKPAAEKKKQKKRRCNPSTAEYMIMIMCRLNPEAIAASFGAFRLIKAHAQGSSMVPRLATLWIGNILQNAVNAKANNISRIPRFKSIPLTR